MVVTVPAAKPELCRERKKDKAKLIDISVGLVDLMKEVNFLKAESY